MFQVVPKPNECLPKPVSGVLNSVFNVPIPKLNVALKDSAKLSEVCFIQLSYVSYKRSECNSPHPSQSFRKSFYFL